VDKLLGNQRNVPFLSIKFEQVVPAQLYEYHVVDGINQLDALLAIVAEDKDLFVTLYFNNEKIDAIRARELLS